MPGTVAVAIIVLAVIPLAVWSYRSNFLLHVAGADPQYIQTAPDRPDTAPWAPLSCSPPWPPRHR